jgi:hypothetical protein
MQQRNRAAKSHELLALNIVNEFTVLYGKVDAWTYVEVSSLASSGMR